MALNFMCYMVQLVSVGKSGRVVIEIDPEFKQDLYEALGKEGKSLKSWFLESAKTFLADKNQKDSLGIKNSQKEVRNV